MKVIMLYQKSNLCTKEHLQTNNTWSGEKFNLLFEHIFQLELGKNSTLSKLRPRFSCCGILECEVRGHAKE